MPLEDIQKENDPFILTAIEQQKKDSKRFSLFINNKFAVGISLNTFEHFDLSKGQRLNRKLIDDICIYEEINKARNKALQYIAKKMRSSFEVQQKLRQVGYPLSVIEGIVQEFRDKQYIDDRDYAETFTRDFLKFKEAGVFKLKKSLQQKGIAANLIEQTIEKYFSSEQQLQKARRLAEKKLQLIKEKEKKKERIYRYLIQKGFENSVVAQTLNDLF